VQTFAVVDLNSAPLADLQTLPGMTSDYARKIIAGRPYQSFREVVERGGIPQVIVEQMTPPAILRVLERSPPSAAVPSAPSPKP
jgi:DNA uptake protein ComE-like DNA-binding protein